MTVYNKFDHVIAEAKRLAAAARTRENESAMIDVILALESARHKITPEFGASEYKEEWY